MNKKYTVGKILHSNKYGDFEIVKIYSHQRYRIRFLLTGYEKDISHSCMVYGEVRDPYFPIYYNKACIGVVDIRNYTKEFNVWRFMIQRCYCKKHSSYNLYGGKGVTVCEQWLCLESF